MKPSEAIKPISYLKAHAAQLIRDVSESRGPLYITQNGEARAVLQDIESYQETQETLALLRMLALSTQHRQQGLSKPVETAFSDVRARVAGAG